MTYPVYPPARKGSPAARTYGALDADLPPALTWHTTETVSWPSYSLGLTAPHYSYKPATREWRWHGADLGRRVGTMRSSLRTGTPANEKAWQVEIVAYSSLYHSTLRPGGLWVGNFSDAHYEDLAAFAGWLAEVTPLDLSHVMSTPPLGWTAGADSPLRLTRDAWLAFDGVGCHGGVTGQTHWDTGVLDLDRIAADAAALPPTLDLDMSLVIDALQRQTPEWYVELERLTGSPAGADPGYWGRSHNSAGDRIKPNPDDGEWRRAAVELLAATFESCGPHHHDGIYAKRKHSASHQITDT